ncbi:unnamed protein product [Lasius platythorax]|uniref:Uncharacterized protein n=1 Tax=Lasius platythorax TaxID=488582 RepID=A0AAV2NL88_9HYME
MEILRMREKQQDALEKLALERRREIRAEASSRRQKKFIPAVQSLLAYLSFTQERAHQDFHQGDLRVLLRYANVD